MVTVIVDTPLAHLDRPFDYLVPEDLDAAVVPGSRVRVRFSGRLVDGFVETRSATSAHEGRLDFVERSVSAEPVLSAEILGLARAVADRWAGTVADVLRLAVPPRHARVERAPAGTPPPEPPAVPSPGGWTSYTAGSEFVSALAGGLAPRAVWRCLPGPGWPSLVATAVQATLASGRGALVVVPDARDVERLDQALAEALGGHESFVVLSADLGPQERYRRWLAVARGQVRCALGTRSAVWAPVRDLGLVVCWDDGDDLHREPRAPYPHARDVLLLRVHRESTALLVAGPSPSVEAEALVESGWARALEAPRSVVRAAAPRVEALGADEDLARDPAARAARLPSRAWSAARASLASGAPVLVQVPRRGYLPSMCCSRCRSAARCSGCAGPLGRDSADPVAACRWCGRPAADFRCAECGGRELRASAVGARRTAEELGRAFTGVVVRTSGRDGVLARVPAEPALVVATPGAEPVAEGGYGTVLLLDGWALLGRPDLRAAEEALRRWSLAAMLARPAREGGLVLVAADSALPVVQALVRWDQAGFARREAAERAALGFPPATRMAAAEGSAEAVADLLATLELPSGAELLGPVEVGPGLERLLVKVPRASGAELARSVKQALAVRAARKSPAVRVHLDPDDLL